MNTLTLPTLGALLRRYRLAGGLSQETLAERSNLSREAISALERGTRRAPRQETLDLLAAALELPPSERTQLQQIARASRVHSEMPRATPSTHRPLSAGKPPPPLVGRLRELAWLEHHLADDGPALLAVAGEPGIGKTRLLREAERRARDTGWTVLAGGCHRGSGQEPYAPLLDVVAHHVAAQPPDARRGLLQGATWLVRLLPELAETALVPAPTWVLPPDQARRLMFAAARRFLANAAGPAGTLLLLDDLQWAGDDALDLLAALLHTGAEAADPCGPPLRVVSAYRDTELAADNPIEPMVEDGERAGQAARLALGPLAPEDAGALLDALLGAVDTVSAPRRARALARAGGVPLYLVSYAGLLGTTADMGAVPAAPVVPTDGRAPDDTDVPASVAQTIRRRVAILPEPARTILGTMAVVGRAAPRRLVLGVARQAGTDEETVVAALEVACRAGLLREEDETTYGFTHDLIHEVVLGDVGAARRALWHRRVAEALEAEPGEPPAAVLADHYERAGELDRAVVYLERAAERARARYAHTEAHDYYQRLIAGLEALGRHAHVDEAREHLGAALLAAAKYDQALATLDLAVAGYRSRQDHEGVARATARIGEAHASRGSFDEGVARVGRLVRDAEAPLTGNGSAQSLACLYDALAQLFQRGARHAEQLEAAERACAYAREAQDVQLLARDQALWGLALASLNRKDEAIPHLEAALPPLRAAGDLSRLFHVWCALSWIYAAWGDNVKLQEYAAQAHAVAQEIENPTLRPEALFVRALHLWMVGDWNDAEAHLEMARSLLSPDANPWTAAQVLVGLSQLRLSRGGPPQEQYFDQARRLIKHAHIEWWIAMTVAEAELVRGDWAPAASRAAGGGAGLRRGRPPGALGVGHTRA